jgi:hypothetical protein
VGFTSHNVVQATVHSRVGLEQAWGQQIGLGGVNSRTEEIPWLLGSRGESWDSLHYVLREKVGNLSDQDTMRVTCRNLQLFESM